MLRLRTQACARHGHGERDPGSLSQWGPRAARGWRHPPPRTRAHWQARRHGAAALGKSGLVPGARARTPLAGRLGAPGSSGVGARRPGPGGPRRPRAPQTGDQELTATGPGARARPTQAPSPRAGAARDRDGPPARRPAGGHAPTIIIRLEFFETSNPGPRRSGASGPGMWADRGEALKLL